MATVDTNPFAVFSPEGLPAEDVVELFVKDVPGVDSIQSVGHTLLMGARGSGKSMIMRFLEPDCQLVAQAKMGPSEIPLTELPYYAAYLTIKQTDLGYPELERLNGTIADHLVNEHLLVLNLALKIIARATDNHHFSATDAPIGEKSASEFNRLQRRVFDTDAVAQIQSSSNILSALEYWREILTSSFDRAINFTQQLVEEENIPSYNSTLLRFSTFLAPFFHAWRSFPVMPHSGKFFLLIDDADRLNETQTRILNSWVAQRLPNISIKVAAELYEYKTFYTLGKSRIEAPHDFQEINLSDVYTSNKADFYQKRIFSIVNRRLDRVGINSIAGHRATAQRFFPEDNTQRHEIEKLEKNVRSAWEAGRGRGFRSRDDVYRYSRPEYIRQLGGKRKSRSTYSYSGFEQLVNISSGIPRFFLEAAHKMYDRELVRIHRKPSEIDADIQDAIIRKQAEDIYMKELEKLKLDEMKSDEGPAHALCLHNLISCLGALFQRILVDIRLSERRVFSFAISDYADEQVSAVLRLGVKYAYFQRTTIGRKEGFGRTERYILTRRLAPMFNLDPNGFSAYKFLLNSELREMMLRPDRYRRSLRRQSSNQADHSQMLLELVREGD